jgi:5-carboxymethyl-2-hydroxymuconate isomerase
MPQIRLELSHNIIEQEFNGLLRAIHALLVKQLPTKLDSCKTRIIRYDRTYIGDGHRNNALVHLVIGILKGRNQELLNSIASEILDLLKTEFNRSLEALNLEISLEIYELSEVYHKYSLKA